MLVSRHMLILKRQGKSDRFRENHFWSSVTLWFLIFMFVGFTDILLRICILVHIAYVCLQTSVDFEMTINRSPCQRSSQQWWFLWKSFPVIIFVSFTDIFWRLFMHIPLCRSSDTYWFRVDQVKGQGDCGTSVKIVFDQYFRFAGIFTLLYTLITYCSLQTPIDFEVTRSRITVAVTHFWRYPIWQSALLVIRPSYDGLYYGMGSIRPSVCSSVRPLTFTLWMQ